MGFLSSLFGSSKSQPATTTNVISQKLPEEIAPFAKEVLGEAQQLYKANIERGYDPFTGQTIAPFTPEQQRSMEGIAGLVGTSKPLQEEALATYRQGAERFTGDTAQQYMSPYQQAVTDIEKREAQRNFEGNVLPRLEAQAVQQGAMSGLGSRAGVEFAEAQRNQAQLLSDIQAKGQQAAFQDARKGFEQQKAREQGMASDLSRLGPAMFATGLQEQGALGAVGEQKQQLAQSALDEAYFKFLEEEQYPQQQLANYSGFVYGNPAAGLIQQTGTGTSTPFQPSFGQTLLGLGSGLGSAFLGSLAGSKAVANKFFKKGGKVSEGLSGLVEKQEGGTVDDDDQPRSLMGDIRRLGEYVIPTAKKINRAGLQTIGDIYTGEAFGIPAAIDYITGDTSQSASEKTIKNLIPSYRTREDTRKLELARARETLKNLAAKKEEPKSVDTETPAVPKVEKPKPKTPRKLTAEDYKREGIRSEKDILQRAEDIAKQKEGLIGDRTRYGLAEGLSDVLGYIAQRALTGESKMDFFTKRKESQAEAEKLLTKTKLQNIDAKAIAEDLGYKAESKVKNAIIARLERMKKAKLTQAEFILKLKKLRNDLEVGTGYDYSKISAEDREKAGVKDIRAFVSSMTGDPDKIKTLKSLFGNLDDDELEPFANQLAASSGPKANRNKLLSGIVAQIIKSNN
jgi:hypothetical protein